MYKMFLVQLQICMCYVDNVVVSSRHLVKRVSIDEYFHGR